MAGRENPDGTRSTHEMAYLGDTSKRRGDFYVYPTIAPIRGKESSTDPKDWVNQSPQEADARGELIKVKSRKKAEKLSAGSWKKGVEKKEAMREYKQSKKKPKP